MVIRLLNKGISSSYYHIKGENMKPLADKTKELLPCPFCGEIPSFPHGRGSQYVIECDNCGQASASVQISDLMTMEERMACDDFSDANNWSYPTQYIERAKIKAIEYWNHRIEDLTTLRTQLNIKIDEFNTLKLFYNLTMKERDFEIKKNDRKDEELSELKKQVDKLKNNLKIVSKQFEIAVYGGNLNSKDLNEASKIKETTLTSEKGEV